MAREGREERERVVVLASSRLHRNLLRSGSAVAKGGTVLRQNFGRK